MQAEHPLMPGRSARTHSCLLPVTTRKSHIALVDYLVILFFIVSIPSALADKTLDLDTLLSHIQVTPPAHVSFAESRQNRLLREPLRLTGYLSWPAARQLEKVVETPFRETLRVDGDDIVISRDGQERRLSLRNRKSFRVMLQSIEAVMTGDRAMLEEYFDIALTGSMLDWRIDLAPRSKRLASQLSRMQVSGANDQILEIRFDLADGEWQLIELLHDASSDD